MQTCLKSYIRMRSDVEVLPRAFAIQRVKVHVDRISRRKLLATRIVVGEGGKCAEKCIREITVIQSASRRAVPIAIKIVAVEFALAIPARAQCVHCISASCTRAWYTCNQSERERE